jgi:menaquinone-dependent protoporphyrinogen IX oxidase
LTEYDLVVIGSGIAAGHWAKESLEFIEKNQEALAKTKVALFVVCGDAGDPTRCGEAQVNYLDAIAAQYPSISPVSTGLFGGMFDFKKYNFAIKALVKNIVKKRMPEGAEVPPVMDFRDPEKVRDWVTGLVNS